jgi:putative two-component system response regulator
VKETLLIVEDNLATLEALHDIFAAEGYSILKAEDGFQALSELSTHTPDLILTDISMPGMDGYELIRKVRAQPEWVDIPVIFLTARGEMQDKLAGLALGVEDYIVKSPRSSDVVTAVRARLERSQQLRNAQLRRAFEASLASLANAIDMRDPYSPGHAERVARYAQMLASELGWHGRIMEVLFFGAILHDIGKLLVKEHVLLKPTALSAEEWEEIREHPVTGAEMVRQIEFLAGAVPIVLSHHEHWDGSGYPEGLAGEAIPLGARIVCVADCFDAMTIDLPYRKAMSIEQARSQIILNSGSHFDPAVVTVFERLWEAGKIPLQNTDSN